MKRREFLKSAGVGLAASTAVAAPAIAQSMPEVKWRMPTSWPKSLDTLYGGCEYFAKRIHEMSDGKFQITVFAAGAADRMFLSIGVPYDTQVWLFRGAFFVVPVVVYFIARRVARELGRRLRPQDWPTRSLAVSTPLFDARGVPVGSILVEGTIRARPMNTTPSTRAATAIQTRPPQTPVKMNSTTAITAITPYTK